MAQGLAQAPARGATGRSGKMTLQITIKLPPQPPPPSTIDRTDRRNRPTEDDDGDDGIYIYLSYIHIIYIYTIKNTSKVINKHRKTIKHDQQVIKIISNTINVRMT